MAVQYKDYYAILGVPRTAGDDEIKKAFRRLARQHHPDVAQDKKAAEEKFKEINEAYEVLGNPENRRRYDQLGTGWRAGSNFRPPPGFERRTRQGSPGGGPDEFEFRFGGTGFSDFFESLFGGRRGSGVDRGFEERPMRGGDIEGDVMVALDEVLHGSVRTITLNRTDPRTGETERASFQVRVPAGVGEGQLIRVAGKGEAPIHGVPGDLYLRVRLARHPDFKVRDRDLFTEATVMAWDAVLGASLKVPTLEGDVHLRIPPGSRTGQQLRLKGRGLPSAGGEMRGDLYVTLSVDVPAKADAESRMHWERLAEHARLQGDGGG